MISAPTKLISLGRGRQIEILCFAQNTSIWNRDIAALCGVDSVCLQIVHKLSLIYPHIASGSGYNVPTVSERLAEI